MLICIVLLFDIWVVLKGEEAGDIVGPPYCIKVAAGTAFACDKVNFKFFIGS